LNVNRMVAARSQRLAIVRDRKLVLAHVAYSNLWHDASPASPLLRESDTTWRKLPSYFTASILAFRESVAIAP
jgi:hypothetical protein